MPPLPFPYHIPPPLVFKTYLQQRRPEAPFGVKDILIIWSSAVLASRRGRLIEALEDHISLIRKAPQLLHTAPLWFNIGALWAILGQLELALDAYEISALSDPGFTIAWYCLGVGSCLVQDYQRGSMAFFFCDQSIDPQQEAQSYDEYGIRFDIVKSVAAWNYRITRDRYRSMHRTGPVNIPNTTFQYSALTQVLEPPLSYFNIPDFDASDESTLNLKKRGRTTIKKVKAFISKMKEAIKHNRNRQTETDQQAPCEIPPPQSFGYYMNGFQDMLPYIDLTAAQPARSTTDAVAGRPLRARRSEPSLQVTADIPTANNTTQLTPRRRLSVPILPSAPRDMNTVPPLEQIRMALIPGGPSSTAAV